VTSMEMTAPAAVNDHAPGQMHAAPAGQAAATAMAADAASHGAHCPMVEKQCAAPKATLGHDVQPGPAPSGLPTAMACAPAAVVALPNAPPPAHPPPDLHRLCVSRT
jgi:hypothetical protein